MIASTREVIEVNDERLRRLFKAKSENDTAFLIESLRRDPEMAPLAAEWLADAGVVEAIQPSFRRWMSRTRMRGGSAPGAAEAWAAQKGKGQGDSAREA